MSKTTFTILLFLCSWAVSLQLSAQKIRERGLAEMIEDTQNTGKLLALHRSLKPGTKVQVKNPVNGLSTVVRVVGKLPDVGANSKVVIKVSQAAYQELRAAGRLFAVELRDPPKGKEITHEVQKGETLYRISKKYEVSVEDIMKWNRLEDHSLSPKQKLKIIQEPEYLKKKKQK